MAALDKHGWRRSMAQGVQFLNLAYPRPILSKSYSILSLLAYFELNLVALQSGCDVTHLSSDRCYTPHIYKYI